MAMSQKQCIKFSLKHRYINFTLNVAGGGGAVKILVHGLNLGRKLVLFHIFNTF